MMHWSCGCIHITELCFSTSMGLSCLDTMKHPSMPHRIQDSLHSSSVHTIHSSPTQSLSCTLQDCNKPNWQHVLELVIPYVDSKRALAKCSFVSQHMMDFVHGAIQQRFHTLLPAFLRSDKDGVGSTSQILLGNIGALQWFCSCAGREHMASEETALHVLIWIKHNDFYTWHMDVLPAAGKPPAAS